MTPDYVLGFALLLIAAFGFGFTAGRNYAKRNSTEFARGWKAALTNERVVLAVAEKLLRRTR